MSRVYPSGNNCAVPKRASITPSAIRLWHLELLQRLLLVLVSLAYDAASAAVVSRPGPRRATRLDGWAPRRAVPTQLPNAQLASAISSPASTGPVAAKRKSLDLLPKSF